MSATQTAIDARGVATLTLSREKVFNAFDEEMIAELRERFETLGADPAVRVIVLAAAGKAFCAGADLNWMQRASKNGPAENLTDAREFAAMMATICDCPKPTIARVQGAAFGGGVGLAAACDIVVASTDAKIAVSEARFGIIPSVIGPYLVRAIGARQATRLALTASRISADEALVMGLVHRVVPAELLDDAVLRLIDELLVNGPNAQTEIKRLFAALDALPLGDEARELTAQTISRLRATDEAREGFAAFFEKRAPAWVRDGK
ncbi:enoyl-CoA hydratase-related protein [Chitinasiproducens palmae]|uniref:Methylglutaconyl-CoA hydratase n=1 Tax=Chitinasiproducens palmae TaxID=1770053 RepID=A0A1H2PIQ7_9BURK|nr:enoyl-CoA hydratase-related protein [Chitinasiproducens palmae]SDV46187.1 methylglutaconyl-CoA hydratase [Chitinasiproducens palmae]